MVSSIQTRLDGQPELRKVKHICCIGAGYVGGPSGAVIANKNPKVRVTIVDLNAERIQAWNSDHLPVYEPGLNELVKTARDGVPGVREPNLFFSTQVDKAIAAADLIFVGVNTPTKTQGVGAGKASDLGWLEAATRRIAKAAEHDTIVVEKSTVPCRTAASLREILQANAKPGVNFEVLSNPEFLAEGTAIKNLLQPDRILIGCLQTEQGWAAARELSEIYASWVPREKLITMNLWSSELTKLAANAMLAQRISSINAFSAICEATGANINEVSYACGLDSRIGPKMLQASVGFGGSCFKKDVLNLVYIAESLNLPEVAAYWENVVSVNEYQKSRFTKRIINALHGNLSLKKITVLGFAYKKDTGDTRESTAITVVNNLIAENAQISIYDPKVTESQIMKDLAEQNSPEALKKAVTVHTNPYEACADAHAVEELPGRLDWTRIASSMQRPMYVFDGRNIIDAAKLEKLGVRVETIGVASSWRFDANLAK
ncbi:UDP-glucose/GDP-mannose dehydrogenase family, NAD binding domain-containing protein [Exophiala viscosa]|uniref:UDP-glucose 6-dehydrogenase n=1 Tax=Exophiala viscosa TaxID=2486360 RepID=A0AAN6DPB7_9EURO|nr:UDP-glucose/GDP-mannose dehydrogenase family, NAD binding domain-containing protein [Exophiala viscosa]KAI1621158.1 UDP-glucose/GDP-mannose dehydrogenase family, NAD binding domain-containing protein [Exophiala viscosa]